MSVNKIKLLTKSTLQQNKKTRTTRGLKRTVEQQEEERVAKQYINK